MPPVFFNQGAEPAVLRLPPPAAPFRGSCCMRYRFRKKSKIKRRRDFQEVYRRGQHIRVFPVRVHYLHRPGATCSRLGLAVGRKAGAAVLRNRWKRAVREAFRNTRHELAGPCDIVVSVSWDAKEKHLGDVKEAFRNAILLMNRTLSTHRKTPHV